MFEEGKDGMKETRCCKLKSVCLFSNACIFFHVLRGSETLTAFHKRVLPLFENCNILFAA